MRVRYLQTLSTPSVLAEQARAYGQARVPKGSDPFMELDPDARGFIAKRDSFYLASLTEDGWPYVQHRGGPPGFLHVISGTELAFADYNGNRQLISTGNVRSTQRVSLFLMDYRARERLKLLALAEILDPATAPAWKDHLLVPPNTRMERIFYLRVEGFDWNCPKYITPRFTKREVDEALQPLRQRIAELEHRLAATMASNR